MRNEDGVMRWKLGEVHMESIAKKQLLIFNPPKSRVLRGPARDTNFMEIIMNETLKPVQIASTKRSQSDSNDGHVEVKNLTTTEVKTFEGTVHGQNWMSVQNGRLVFRGIFAPLPEAIPDEEMLPFWRHATEGEVKVQEELFDKSARLFGGEHIMIQSLCGYYRSAENYQKQAKKLEDYGFIQLRSKRGEDGRYWEIWYLPGVWFAQGELKEIVESITLRARSWEDPYGEKERKTCFEAVLKHIQHTIQFGTLDISVQRMCMVVDD